MKYIFGYGSLLYAAGINGRGMKRLYSDQELLPTILVDYQRRWNASYSGGILYLGLSPMKGAITNGVLFPIDGSDLQPFLHSEGFDHRPPMYALRNVTKQIARPPSLKTSDIVFTCVTLVPRTGTIRSYYQRIIVEALRVRGPEFTEAFFKLTPPPEQQEFVQEFRVLMDQFSQPA